MALLLTLKYCYSRSLNVIHLVTLKLSPSVGHTCEYSLHYQMNYAYSLNQTERAKLNRLKGEIISHVQGHKIDLTGKLDAFNNLLDASDRDVTQSLIKNIAKSTSLINNP